MAPKRSGSDSVVGEAKKKHKHMTISVQQVDLLRKLDKGVSVWILCQQYNIGPSTAYDIKKQKNQLLSFSVSLTVRRAWRFVKHLEKGKAVI